MKRQPAERGRRVTRRSHMPLLATFGLEDLSWPVIGWTFALLIVGFGPWVLAMMLDVGGNTYRFLVALGPTLVGLGFAGMTWHYGMQYARAIGRSRRSIQLLTLLFVVLALLAGWGLFSSV
ncbi:MAG TPA: hypothetical protein PKA05_22595 [Roseiflexaceae bacterium]|nr:hypothetical protein [Roseiflexaceae bacterium]HMP43182.1 hypothetical protein [Roseiflexaceae bacterium]